jgi:hypothetical protein
MKFTDQNRKVEPTFSGYARGNMKVLPREMDLKKEVRRVSAESV